MRISDWSSDVCSSDLSAYLIARHCVPHLRQTRGSIINIASVAGLKGTPGAVAYNSSKSAVVGMTKCMALDLVASGGRVNCIRSEEHTYELQFLKRISYAVFLLKKPKRD